MTEFQIHHTDIDFDLGDYDIPMYRFNSFFSISHYILSLPNEGDRVYLVAMDGDQRIFCNPNPLLIHEFVRNFYDMDADLVKIYLQEYGSFEEAYGVALMMVEGETNLCYEL